MPRRSGRKPNLHWTRVSASQNALAAGSAGNNVSAAAHGTETMLRLRGQLLAYIDGAQAPGSSIIVSVGLILVPDGTGTTVLWDPFNDGDAPWWYFTEFTLGYEEMVTDVVDVPILTAYRETIDTKAMRIVRSDTELQMVTTNTTQLTAASLNLTFSGRILSQE